MNISAPLADQQPHTLVLWDIDHTLIESRGVGPAVYRRAFRAATGRNLQDLVIVPGWTELAITAETLRTNGLEVSDQTISALIGRLVEEFRRARVELATIGRELPGASEILKCLSAEPAIHQTVLTGNVRAVAQVKLEAFDLDRFVDLESAAFGDDGYDRAALVSVAQHRAGLRTGVTFCGETTVIIGDSVEDIRAARKAQVRAIGVATGASTLDELRYAGADDLLPDLCDHARVRRLILGDVRATRVFGFSE
ncbi:HAD family hydrolase [Nocardia barduliensis]|uniref:HAD family hydrolase n=1 Tax=Nocardia barduliensis TaxID=2736643 RepID=UPI001C2D22EB|nr:haloacid dehalogenase-like hydrolase [Nocardia barduliensis]